MSFVFRGDPVFVFPAPQLTYYRLYVHSQLSYLVLGDIHMQYYMTLYITYIHARQSLVSLLLQYLCKQPIKSQLFTFTSQFFES